MSNPDVCGAVHRQGVAARRGIARGQRARRRAAGARRVAHAARAPAAAAAGRPRAPVPVPSMCSLLTYATTHTLSSITHCIAGIYC